MIKYFEEEVDGDAVQDVAKAVSTLKLGKGPRFGKNTWIVVPNIAQQLIGYVICDM